MADEVKTNQVRAVITLDLEEYNEIFRTKDRQMKEEWNNRATVSRDLTIAQNRIERLEYAMRAMIYAIKSGGYWLVPTATSDQLKVREGVMHQMVAEGHIYRFRKITKPRKKKKK